MATPSAGAFAAMLVIMALLIQRMGHWSREAITQSYLPFFRAAGLLAAANWPGAANNEFASAFWHERFLIEVPEELLLLVFSGLKVLETRVRGCLLLCSSSY